MRMLDVERDTVDLRSFLVVYLNIWSTFRKLRTKQDNCIPEVSFYYVIETVHAGICGHIRNFFMNHRAIQMIDRKPTHIQCN